MGDCALITPVYLEIALFSGARSGTQATGQIIGVIGIADISIRARYIADATFLSMPSARRATESPLTIQIENDEFLSTPSARRATRGAGRRSSTGPHFYPRPPRGGRLYGDDLAGIHVQISIHALCEKGDPVALRTIFSGETFLSTPSARRATGVIICYLSLEQISIHALREEGDPRRVHGQRCTQDFYPRPPRGGRRFQ